jgi:hypothetical protein
MENFEQTKFGGKIFEKIFDLFGVLSRIVV